MRDLLSFLVPWGVAIISGIFGVVSIYREHKAKYHSKQAAILSAQRMSAANKFHNACAAYESRKESDDFSELYAATSELSTLVDKETADQLSGILTVIKIKHENEREVMSCQIDIARRALQEYFDGLTKEFDYRANHIIDRDAPKHY